ncbi:MAG: PAS domain S-box protein [Desulfobacterales bacterium]|nr:PAS domain S-box protein [Desulfobacterales bacterium]
MHIELDARTLFFAGSVSSFIISTALIVSRKNYPDIKGLNEWAMAGIAYSISWFLFVIREHLPISISIVLANVLMVLANTLYYKAIGDLKEKRHSLLFHFILIAAVAISFFLLSEPQKYYRERVLIICFVMAIQNILCSFALLEGISKFKTDEKLPYYVSFVTFMIQTVLVILRFLIHIHPNPNLKDLFSTNFLATITHVGMMTNFIIVGFCFIWIANQRIQYKLTNSGVRLREAQRIANFGSWELNLLNNKLIWSEEIFSIFEIDSNLFEASYQSFLNLIHPEDRDMVNNTYATAVTNKSNYDIVHRLLMPNGRIKFVRERCEHFYDADGKAIRSLGTIQEVTESVLAEQKLRESEEKFRQLADNIDEVFWIRDVNKEIIYISPAYEKIWGRTCESLYKNSKSFLESAHPDDKERVFTAFINDNYTDGNNFNLEYRIIKPDGEIRWIWARTSPIKDCSGKIIRKAGIAEDITARKQAEQALNQSLENYKTIINTTTDGFWIIGSSGNFIDVNEAYCKLIGYSKKELLKKSIEDLEVLENPKETEEHIKKIVETGYDRFETKHRAKDGSIIDIEVNSTFLKDLAHFVVFVRDIREKKQHDAKLTEALDLNQKLIAASWMGIAVYDYNGQCILANEPMAKIVSATLEQVLQQNFRRIQSWKKNGIFDLAEEALKTMEGRRGEFHHITTFGRDVWLDCYFSPFITGGAVHLLLMVNDITEKKKVNDTLKESENRYRLLFENAAEAIYILSAEGENAGAIINANRASAVMHGYTVEELERMHITDLDIPEVAADAGNKIERILNGEWVKGETFHVKKDKSLFPIEYAAGLLELDNKKYILAFSNDISERKKAEAIIITAKETAESANRAKSQFLANISHEIRTPMNAIIGLGYLVLQTQLSAKQRDYLNKMQSSAKSLLGIINDVLDFSKIDAGKLELDIVDFYIDNILDNIANLFTAKVEEKGIELLFSIDNNIPRCLIGDPLRISQILTNLVNNAVKFTEKGQIILSLKAEEITNQKAVIRFSIEDTGVGMKPELISNLFSPFTQADASTTRKYGGTGLGLTICKKLIEMMKSDISVKSEYGKGSIFSFKIKFGCQESCTSPEYIPPSKIKGIRVLVVDDNSSAREIFREMLMSFGFRVTDVSSGVSAIEELRRVAILNEDPYRLIIMDWQMPNMDGFEATNAIINEIKFNYKPIIIMVSAYGREEIKQRAENIGIKHFLSKPVQPSSFFNAIIEAFDYDNGFQVKRHEIVNPKNESLNSIKGSKILLVEDHHLNQIVASELLQQAGLQVEIAQNGIEAVNMLKKGENNFDLVFMDLQMPIMDGFEATKQIRKKFSANELPIIAMTAHAMNEERQKCFNAGMNDHLAKPIDIDGIYKILIKWIKPKQKKIQAIPEKTIVQHEDNDLPSEIMGIDIPSGLKRLGNNKALLKRLIIDFKNSNTNILADINDAISKQAYSKLKDLIHGLKGMSGNISANYLFLICKEFETSVIEGNSKDFLYYFDKMKDELNKIIKSASILEQNNAQVLNPDNKNNIVSDNLSKIFKELNNLLKINDLKAINYFHKVKSELIGISNDEKLNGLELGINKLNFKEALMNLKTLAKDLSILLE